MKKSTLAVAALLAVLSTAPVVSIAYADDANAKANTSCKSCGCKGCSESNGSKDNSGDE